MDIICESWPRLVVIRGHGRGEAFPLQREVTTIGRSAGNHVLLGDAAISRRHAEVRREGTEYVVRDLGSANGLVVNGCRVSIQALRDGDDLQLGDTVLIFAARPARASSEPEPATDRPAATAPLARNTITLEVRAHLEGDSQERLQRDLAAYLERGRQEPDAAALGERCGTAPDVAALIGEAAARLGEGAVAEASHLLTRLRRSADAGQERELVVGCLRVQRRLGPHGLLDLLAQAHGMGDDEWPLLLRLLLEEPPDEREERATCIADSRIRSLAWRAVGSPAAGARTVTGAETILHDVIKHGFPQLEAAQRLARLRPLPRVECGPIHLFLDDLSQWLNGLEVAPRLLLDELELADALRQRAVWGRDESSELEELVSTVRRILEQLTAQLWVAVPAVVQHVVARHREQGVTVDVQCDPDRSGSMRVVAELHAVESLVGNLVMNAVQATRGAVRPKILIDLRLLPGAVRRNPLIEISVEDTGAGAACALRSSHGGMGLDIASRHLQAMQGSIEERASPLGGRAFVVRFPRLALPPEAPAPPPAPRPAITAPASPRSYEELVQRTRKSGGDE